MTTTAPRVSFVVGSRNDTHGGNPRRRTEIFVHGLAALCARCDFPAELVVVEWNPPADRAPLAEALTWPAQPGPLSIRVVTVPAAVHQRFDNADRVPFFQMIAKNAGIRRARGEFVVATNIDLLFSEALVWFLAHGPLDPGSVYRVERLDVRLRDLPLGLDIDEQLALCSLNVARRNALDGAVELDAAASRARYGHAAERWPGFAPGELVRLLADAECEAFFHEACGDFTMLARSAWGRLRGHPELALYSMHQDTIFLKLALVGGLRQIVLPDPMRSYHIEHGMGWGVAADRPKLMAALPMLTDEAVRKLLDRLDAAGRPLTPNTEDWGLAAEDLPEWRAA